MGHSFEKAPAFAVNISDDHKDTTGGKLTPDGSLVWENQSNFKLYGEWPEHRLHTVTTEIGRAAIFGDCTSHNSAIDSSVRRAISENRPELLGSLDGSYAAVLLDSRNNQVAAVSSLSSQPPIYFGRSDARTVISNRPSLVGSGNITPDLRYIASQLVMPDLDGTLIGNRSSYEEVSKLQGGQMLVANEKGAHVSTYNTLIPDPDISLDDAAERLREALKSATAARVMMAQKLSKGALYPPSSDFSGGLDSTSLAHILARNMGEIPIKVFTSYLPGIDEGDIKYVRRFTQGNPHFNLHIFEDIAQMGNYSYQDFLNTPRAEDFAIAKNVTPGTWKFIDGYYKFIANYGGGPIHITGDGGDEVTDMAGGYLPDLIATRQLSRFLSDGISWARLSNASVFNIWKSSFLLASSGPQKRLMKIAAEINQPQGSSSDPFKDIRLWKPLDPGLSWLHTEMRAELRSYLDEIAADMKLHEGQNIGDYMAQNLVRSGAIDCNMLSEYVGYGGTKIYPQSIFHDNEVISAAFSLPAYARGNPHEFKSILKKALSGVVRPDIFERRTKGTYDESNAKILRDSRTVFEDVIADSELERLGIIDANFVRKTLTRVDTASVDKVWALNRFLSAEGWLRAHGNKQAAFMPQGDRERITLSNTSVQSMTNPELRGSFKGLSSDILFVMPPHVYARASELGSLVVFNSVTNNFYPLDKTQSNFLRLLSATGKLEHALHALVDRYPRTDSEQIRQDLSTFIDDAVSKKIIHPSAEPQPRELPSTSRNPDFTASEITMSYGKEASGIKLRNRALAAGAFIIGGLLVGRVSPGTRLPLLRFMQEKWANKDATIDEAQRHLRAAQSLPYLGRIACLEGAYTSALTMAATRKRVDYHQGVSFDPLAFHAWIATHGEPIRTELEGQVIGSFQSFYTE